MPAIVIDSSIALQWVLPERGVEATLRYVKAEGVTSPDILLVETANVLGKKVRAKDITAEQAIASLAAVKDAVQLVLMQLGGKLVTRDAPFIKRVVERGFGHLLEPAL